MEEMQWQEEDDMVIGPFFPEGYVIELGKDQYFQRWERKRIRTGTFILAKCFRTIRTARRFADRCFWYEGMNPRICHIRWYLTAWENGEKPVAREEYYWTGEKYTKNREEALSFPNYYEAKEYQAGRTIENYAYLDFAPFPVEDEKEGKQAA